MAEIGEPCEECGTTARRRTRNRTGDGVQVLCDRCVGEVLRGGRRGDADLVTDGGVDRSGGDTERTTRPGVCSGCGYRIRPNKDDFTSVGGYDFAHEDCVGNGNATTGTEQQ
jgi:hypothetical protein